MLKIFHKWKFLELVSLLSWVLESEHGILECFTPVTPPWCTCCCCLVFLLKLAVYFDHKLNNIIIILIFNDFNMPFPLLTVTSCNSDPQQLLSFCLRDTHTRMHTHTRLLHSLESPVCCQVLTGKGNLSSPAQLTSGHAKVLGPMCVGCPLPRGPTVLCTPHVGDIIMPPAKDAHILIPKPKGLCYFPRQEELRFQVELRLLIRSSLELIRSSLD